MKTVPVGSTSTLIASAYTGRAALAIQNNSAVIAFLKFDDTTPPEATALDGWRLNPGDSLFLDGKFASNAVYGITSGAADAQLTVQGA